MGFSVFPMMTTALGVWKKNLVKRKDPLECFKDSEEPGECKELLNFFRNKKKEEKVGGQKNDEEWWFFRSRNRVLNTKVMTVILREFPWWLFKFPANQFGCPVLGEVEVGLENVECQNCKLKGHRLDTCPFSGEAPQHVKDKFGWRRIV